MSVDHTTQSVEPGGHWAAGFIDALQSRNTHALGFLTHVAIHQAIDRGCVIVAWENGQPCGYLIRGKLRQTTRIIQAVVADDARRLQHATALIAHLIQAANAAASHGLLLHCAEDLESNAFWQALGFTQTGRRLRDSTGRRWQNRYELDLPGKKLAELADKTKIEDAGLGNLRRLLLKGSIDLAACKLQSRTAAQRQKGNQNGYR